MPFLFARYKNSLALLAGIALCLVPAPSLSADIAKEFQAGDVVMLLKGQAVWRYAVVFEVYRAGLYLPAATPSNRVLQDVAKRLELHYNYEISARDIKNSGEETLARNWPPDVLAAQRGNLNRMYGNYVDVGPGDSYALTYLPGKGTTLSLNGEHRVTIPGAVFSALMFSIWFGEKPFDEQLKASLLGRD